eukprot:scaffold5502_cov115-Isochrysis_galbana.AAC.7
MGASSGHSRRWHPRKTAERPRVWSVSVREMRRHPPAKGGRRWSRPAGVARSEAVVRDSCRPEAWEETASLHARAEDERW